VIRKEVKRWLKALKIAKIIFEDEGYHTRYLEATERFIRGRLMYRPKIKEEYMPILSKISESKTIPMTKLVNQIIEDYLDEKFPLRNMEVMHGERKSEAGPGEHCSEV